MSEQIESMDEYKGSAGLARYWDIELNSSDDEEREWREEGEDVVDRYRADKEMSGIGREKKFNILWSNTETLKGALFARMAKPEIRRRYLDRDPNGRQVAELLERALEYSSDVYDERDIIAGAIEDYLLPGRGVVWVVKEDIMIEVDAVDEFGFSTGEKIEEIGDQRVYFEYVHWEDYRESPAKRPEDVRWKARRHLMTRDDLRDLSPTHADKVPLNWSPSETGEYNSDDVFRRAEVWEIWCEDTRKRYYVVKGFPALLLEEDDPYELENFFPTPKPIISIKTNGSGVPVPEFRLYQDQADELDRITTRIAKLTDGLRRRGIYDGSIPELAKLAEAADNVFIPADNYANLAQKGGLAQSMQTEDISQTAGVLTGLYQQRAQLIQTIYEVTGISDVIRGSTNPNETATAQRLKGQFGSMRLKQRQDQVQRFIRDLYRIRAELISEHFQPYILQNMTGLQVTPEMLQIMRSDKLRSYRVDIETDSTVFEDAQMEQRNRIEFVNTMGAYLEKAISIVQVAPELTPIAFQSLEFMVRGFKIGREFEDLIDEAKQNSMQQMQQVKQMQQQMQQQGPPPDPKMIEAQQKAQLKNAELQQKGQLKGAELQQKGQLEMAKMSQDAQIDREQMAVNAQIAREKNMTDAEIELLKGAGMM
tara:strand:- start:1119 stop:3068 length:1950 start_codon:yes stop_codon:yes gene_type:complete